jgi:hypothetical protein
MPFGEHLGLQLKTRAAEMTLRDLVVFKSPMVTLAPSFLRLRVMLRVRTLRSKSLQNSASASPRLRPRESKSVPNALRRSSSAAVRSLLASTSVRARPSVRRCFTGLVSTAGFEEMIFHRTPCCKASIVLGEPLLKSS